MFIVFGMIIIDGFDIYGLPDGLIIAAIVVKTIVFLCMIVKLARMFK